VVGAQGGRGEGSDVGSSGDRPLSTEEAFTSWCEGGAVAASTGIAYGSPSAIFGRSLLRPG
jgi:hypothetical protein